MKSVLLLLYGVLVLVQLFAVAAGLSVWLDLHWIFTALGALVLASIPLVGTLTAALAAMAAWGWTWAWTSIFFAGLLLLVAGFAILATSRRQPDYQAGSG